MLLFVIAVVIVVAVVVVVVVVVVIIVIVIAVVFVVVYWCLPVFSLTLCLSFISTSFVFILYLLFYSL